MTTLKEIAEKNVREHLRDNPCRGIALGMSDAGVLTQVSWIMGRSTNSQNRVYVVDDEILKTEAADPSKVEDPKLIIYNVMRSYDIANIVSNGDQTDSIIEQMRNFCDSENRPSIYEFFAALETRFCEPDAPNFTPRISGYQDVDCPEEVVLSVLKAEPFAKEHWIETAKASGLTKDHFKREDRKPAEIDEDYKCAIDYLAKLDHNAFPTLYEEFVRAIEPGFGYMLTTYMPGSKELPSFQGEPLLVPMRGSLEEVMQSFWDALEPSFRVAVGGREIASVGGYTGCVRYATPINRFTKVEGGKKE